MKKRSSHITRFTLNKQALDMARIAFLTMDSLADFVSYDQLVVDQLRESGVSVDEISWRAPGVDWNRYLLVVIRSPWDYQQDPVAFLQVLDRIQHSQTVLLNSLDVVRWNIRKYYLRDLEQQGVRIVPTLWLESPGPADLDGAFDRLQTDELVGKPLIGANADHAWRLHRSTPRAEFDSAVSAWRGTTALIQPFVPSILDIGEFSLIYFEGRFSHAIRKIPASGDFRVQEEHGGQIEACSAAADLLELAEACLRAVPERLLYARIDLVRLPNGQPAVMEAELIEPSLYLAFDADSPARFAAAIQRRIAVLSDQS
ncbi:MAG: RimK family alpha-L-glutamate ligase [Planctomycetota bacterium]